MSTLKSFSILLVLLLSTITINAFQDVSLEILYNKQPVIGHYIELKNGDVIIGTGTTNREGKVKINANLMSKSIDIYGKITQENAKKTWQLIGYITLDENFTAVIELSKYAKEIADDSEGLLNEEGIAISWGLTETGVTAQQDPIKEQSTLTPAKMTSSEEKGYGSEEESDDYKVVYGSSSTYRDAMDKSSAEEEEKPGSEKAEIKNVVHSVEKVSLQQKINLQELKLSKKKENLEKKKTKGLLSASQEEIKQAEINVLELKIQENYAKLERMD
jgi:hypothetical protein